MLFYSCVFIYLLQFIHCDNSVTIRKVTEPVDHGEEPHWDPYKQVLYFVDMTSRKVMRLDPKTSIVTSILIDGGEAVTPVIPRRGKENQFIVGVDRDVKLLKWTGLKNETVAKDKLKTLNTVDNDHPQNRFNDGKADRNGRLWIGTIGYENASGVIPNQASLFRMTGKDLNNVVKELTPVSISNGLAWTKDNKIFYYVDTPTRKIARFDYDAEIGKISNESVAFDLANYPEIQGVPDGMTIDTNDNLWVALYHGHGIIHVDPRAGKLLSYIELPAKDVTSTMFGGENLQHLYVTTSKRDLTPEEKQQQPEAGSVFQLEIPNVRGYQPPFTVVLEN